MQVFVAKNRIIYNMIQYVLKDTQWWQTLVMWQEMLPGS